MVREEALYYTDRIAFPTTILTQTSPRHVSLNAPLIMPLRIFIVEDHLETLKAVQAYLERRGHAVTTATLMQEALTLWAPEAFDLLLADIGLPDGDGWEMMRLLRNNPPRYAVAMSGYGTPADVAHSQRVGFKRHLVKPVRHEDLDAVLAEAQAAKDALPAD